MRKLCTARFEVGNLMEMLVATDHDGNSKITCGSGGGTSAIIFRV